MRLEEKWGKLAREVQVRVMKYNGEPYLEVVKGLVEIEHGNVPEHIRKYPLHLPKSLEHKKVYLIDIETCGLAYSSPINTITIGKINGEFLTRTFFALDYFGERPILSRTLNMLKNSDVIFTYNGEAFDMERLSRRMQYHGLLKGKKGKDAVRFKDSLKEVHIDLYPILKELMDKKGKPLLDKKLQTLEKVLFNTYRENEVHGADIPMVYKSFIYGSEKSEERTKQIEEMGRVISHNILDVASMGSVLEYLRVNNIIPRHLSSESAQV